MLLRLFGFSCSSGVGDGLPAERVVVLDKDGEGVRYGRFMLFVIFFVAESSPLFVHRKDLKAPEGLKAADLREEAVLGGVGRPCSLNLTPRFSGVNDRGRRLRCVGRGRADGAGGGFETCKAGVTG